jgi:endonuclease/exonuclease/phosphatase family metal-dependent hydrolase
MPFLGFHGYSVSSSNYGVWYNDFMGCLIAYPRELELESMHISRVARTKSWPRAPPPTRVQRAKDFLNPVGWVRSALALPGQTKHYVHSKIAGVLGLKTPKKVRDDSKADPWALAMKRENTAVMVRLKKQGVGGSFVVATYHMPCLYYCPPTMSIHASLVVKAVQKWAGGDPYVLMGDFNFMPSGDAYSLVTTGSLPEGSAGLPAYPNPNDPWRIDLEQTVTSAYVLKNKEDPEISYYSRMWGKPMFEDTLDYIFLPSNSDMEVVSVVPVLTKADLKDCDSLPDQDEPSDHLLLGATLRMPLIQ